MKPNSWGSFSGKIYNLGDSKLFRFKILSDTYYNEPMGAGEHNRGSNKPDKEWTYPSPKSSYESILNAVCSWIEVVEPGE